MRCATHTYTHDYTEIIPVESLTKVAQNVEKQNSVSEILRAIPSELDTDRHSKPACR